MTKKKPQTVQRIVGASRQRRGSVKKSAVHIKAKHVIQGKIRTKRTWTKRLIMHPLSTFAMLVVGVSLVGLSYRVAATDYAVNAVVQAPPLQSGANITAPTNNSAYSTRPIVVTGECPDDSYVKLTRNGAFSGVAICSGKVFQIVTDLFLGVNDLQAQDYNITDQPGPVTPIVRVTYTPPAGSEEPSGGSAGQYFLPSSAGTSDGSAANLPLLLSSDYHFNVAITSELFEWSLQYHTGTVPISTRVEWGDGTKSTMSVPSHEAFKISHRYATSGYYPIIVTGTDANSRTVSLQLVAFIKRPGEAATSGSILYTPSETGSNGKSAGTGGSKYQWLKYAWPTYGVISVMALSFWLGERREFLQLMKSPSLRKRHFHT